MVRPRGWHLVEKHFLVDGKPISASLFDFGLFFFHNATDADRATARGRISICRRWKATSKPGCGTTFSCFAQDELGIPRGTIRATVLIETILAAFEMDEILCELREHSAGLNCGRWDYIFSFIKKFRNHPDFVLPDRRRSPWTGTSQVLCRPADSDLPSPRHPRHGRDGGADSRSRTIRRPTKRRWKRSGRTNCAKCAPATMERGWRIRGSCRLRKKSSILYMRSRTRSAAPRERCHITAQDLACASPKADHRAGLRWNIDVGLAISGVRGCAATGASRSTT